MKVLIDTTALGRGPSGTSTYLRGLIGALRELDGIEVVEAAARPRRRGRADGARRGPAGTARSLANLAAERRWLRRGLPRVALEERVDLIHHPLPAWSTGFDGPQAITVHDLAFERLPWAFDPRWRAVARVQHRRAALRADAVICVSRTTADDVRSLWGVPASRIAVAPHGVSSPAEPGSLPALFPDDRPYALYVGDDEPRKNLSTLLTAWQEHFEASGRDGRPGLALVVAGSAAGNPALRRLQAEGVSGLRVLESPGAGVLQALYADAALLVHPSLHEGFGLTPLEAMAAGTAVLAARSPGLVEVCGEAASYFDPRDPTELVRRLDELAADPEERRRLGAAGAEQASGRLWSRTAELHVDAYQMALNTEEHERTPVSKRA